MNSLPSCLPLEASKIHEALPASTRERLARLDVIEQMASTNDILHEPTAEIADRVCIALHQSEARGRQGRRWEMGSGALCLSVLHVCPSTIPVAISLWIGLALIERLRALGLGQPCLKWPNDLMYGSAKFGGILTECRTRDGQTRCVVGVGINVEAVPEVDRPVTSIAQVCGRSPEPNQLAADVIDAVSTGLAQLDEGEQADLVGSFARYDGLRDQEVIVTHKEQTLVGHARGVDVRGHLIFEGADGVQMFDSADVRVSGA